ncbi:MAG: hypothetical protein HC921_13040 [Synechococcaceae cyanobacterium SM2_3_1]|nr:hypothetical protein [Synechococcaceae cyanobacterium SM2_3_1]
MPLALLADRDLAVCLSQPPDGLYQRAKIRFAPVRRKLWPRSWTLLFRTALLGLVGGLVAMGWVHKPVLADVLVLKQGQLQTLPPLQTRARLPLQPLEMLYLGMLEPRFLAYAVANNWQVISVTRNQDPWVRWQLLPGGESVDPPLLDPTATAIYARGFVVQAYFAQDRLQGMHLIRDPREPGFDLGQLEFLIRGWFPDNRILLRYQVLPDDPSQQVISAYLGDIPPAFVGDLARTSVPFCPVLLSPNLALPLPPPDLDPLPQCQFPANPKAASLRATLGALAAARGEKILNSNQ